MDRLYESTKNLAGRLKMQTLNTMSFDGTVDVIAIKDKDNKLSSTPFHARFGRLTGTIVPADRVVNLEVNGCIIVDLFMILDDDGVAYFPDDETHKSDDNIKPDRSFVTSISCPNFDSMSSKPPVDSFSGLPTSISLPLFALQPEQPEETQTASELLKNIFEADSCDTKGRKKKKEKEKVVFSKDSSQVLIIPPKKPDNGTSVNQRIQQKRVSLAAKDLEKLGLQPGVNELRYFIKNSTKKCLHAFVYLWSHEDKLVISDIDGTITKSNVRGQILSRIGRDWYHDNIVDLFQSIAHMGYRIVYLSARSICQSEATRSLIGNLNQNNKRMPNGPLLLNPVSYMNAIQMELIDKSSDQFKIACMKNIKELCEPKCPSPLYAGFGNNLMDVNSYHQVGIKQSLVFIINQLGEICLSDNGDSKLHSDKKKKLSYKKLMDALHDYFPPSTSTSIF